LECTLITADTEHGRQGCTLKFILMFETQRHSSGNGDSREKTSTAHSKPVKLDQTG